MLHGLGAFCFTFEIPFIVLRTKTTVKLEEMKTPRVLSEITTFKVQPKKILTSTESKLRIEDDACKSITKGFLPAPIKIPVPIRPGKLNAKKITEMPTAQLDTPEFRLKNTDHSEKKDKYIAIVEIKLAQKIKIINARRMDAWNSAGAVSLRDVEFITNAPRPRSAD
jgi:hypothetical protein